ncbi:Zn-binding domain-containing protein [Methylorubrum thiocyanatum]|uniref:Zn-binding domain-containing protein n=1 Tax=Methylorubrum thiocyanatum TaxID=47958 RepID=UPI0035C81848
MLAELALECGYPLSSLKERIYASGTGQPDRYGLLIYTSTAGGQGTLGGLSSMAEQVPQILHRAIERLILCSNDPICAEHGPDNDHDDRPLHGAACHACSSQKPPARRATHGWTAAY